MEHRISATELARHLAVVLGRIRFRGERFVVERNGAPVARLEPVAGLPQVTVREALAIWQAGEPDPAFAAALERIGAADRSLENPGAS